MQAYTDGVRWHGPRPLMGPQVDENAGGAIGFVLTKVTAADKLEWEQDGVYTDTRQDGGANLHPSDTNDCAQRQRCEPNRMPAVDICMNATSRHRSSKHEEAEVGGGVELSNKLT